MMSTSATKRRFDEVEAARREFMDGLASVDDFARAMHKSRRTIECLMGSGALSVVRLGGTPFVDVRASRKATKPTRKLLFTSNS